MREPIYKGATRPAVAFGVPLAAFIVATAGAAMLGMYALILVGAWTALAVAVLYVPAMLWMRQVTKKDDQRLRQILLRLRLGVGARSSLWRGARSFSVVELRQPRRR